MRQIDPRINPSDPKTRSLQTDQKNTVVDEYNSERAPKWHINRNIFKLSKTTLLYPSSYESGFAIFQGKKRQIRLELFRFTPLRLQPKPRSEKPTISVNRGYSK